MAAARIFGIGVDVAHVPRFERSFQRFGKRFLKRAYHADEIAEFYARPVPHRAEFLASRWAVKEATFKAFQRYRVLFPEIRVGRQRVAHASHLPPIRTALPIADELKALELLFSGETAATAEQLALVEPHVSLSHDADCAIAFVVLQQRLPVSDSPV